MCWARTVGGVDRDADQFEAAGVHHLRGHGAFDEIVDVRGDEDGAAGLAEGVAGAAESLQRARDAFRRGDHDDEIDEADVDAHLKAGGADHGAELALLEAVLDVEADLAVERGVVDFDLAAELGQDLLEAMADALGAAAGVGEDERGAEIFEQLGEFLENARGGVAGGRVGIFSEGREDLDDRFLRRRGCDDGAGRAHAGEEIPDDVERRDGGGEADAAEGARRSEGFHAFRADHEVGAAFIFGERVDFVDDEEAARGEHGQP